MTNCHRIAGITGAQWERNGNSFQLPGPGIDGIRSVCHGTIPSAGYRTRGYLLGTDKYEILGKSSGLTTTRRARCAWSAPHRLKPTGQDGIRYPIMLVHFNIQPLHSHRIHRWNLQQVADSMMTE